MPSMLPNEKRGFMPDKLAKFEEDLEELHVLLKQSREPLTALRIKKLLKCSKQAVYSRLKALKERGVALKVVKVREGQHGPYSKAYSLTH